MYEVRVGVVKLLFGEVVNIIF